MYNELKNKRQLKLNSFCSLFDVPRSTALQWYHSSNFPMYKMEGRWYVDMEEYYTWRDAEHDRCYVYST